MASLDELNAQLQRAVDLLDGAAGMIRDLGLDPQVNIRRIGEALASVFEIRQEIYHRRPDLVPEWLRPR